MSIIQFPDVNKPDPDCIGENGKGETIYPFQVTYTIDADRQFTFDVWGTSFEDADRKLQELKESAEVTGQIFSAEKLTELE